mgnify:CR=1 FL=1
MNMKTYKEFLSVIGKSKPLVDGKDHDATQLKAVYRKFAADRQTKAQRGVEPPTAQTPMTVSLDAKVDPSIL